MIRCRIQTNSSNSTEWIPIQRTQSPTIFVDVNTTWLGNNATNASSSMNWTTLLPASSIPTWGLPTVVPTNDSGLFLNTTKNESVTPTPTKFFDDNNTNPYPAYTLPTTEDATPLPTEIITIAPSNSTSGADDLAYTILGVLIGLLFFFMSS